MEETKCSQTQRFFRSIQWKTPVRPVDSIENRKIVLPYRERLDGNFERPEEISCGQPKLYTGSLFRFPAIESTPKKENEATN